MNCHITYAERLHFKGKKLLDNKAGQSPCLLEKL